MATIPADIAQGHLIKWSDIQTLYTNLNTARTKFSVATVTVPSNPGAAAASQIDALNNYVNELKSVSFASVQALIHTTVPKTITGVNSPTAGTLIYPLETFAIADAIVKLNDACAFDAFNSNNGFRSDNGNNGFRSFDGFNSNNGFRSDNGNNGFRSFDGFNSNNGFRSFNSNNGFRSFNGNKTLYNGYCNRFN